MFSSALFPDLLDLNDDSVQGTLFSTCGKVKLVQGNVAATIARMKTSLNSLDQAVLKRADVSNGGPCACGKNSNKEDTDRVSCKDGKRKTKCPCATEGIGCTENCKFRNCGNTIQTGAVSTALGTAKEENEEEKRYPATRENVELNF